MKSGRTAKAWIRSLGLRRHPEGGYYRETYRSEDTIPARSLPARFGGARSFATAIYFLLEHPAFSAFHRLKADEIWHFYDGSALLIHIIDSRGGYRRIRLGGRSATRAFQAVIKAGDWFAAEVADRGSFTLVGCTVAPGFTFPDFELADRSELCRRHPGHRALISRLTPHNAQRRR